VSEDISALFDPTQMGRGGGIVAMLLGAGLFVMSAYMWWDRSFYEESTGWPFGVFGGLAMMGSGYMGFRWAAQQKRKVKGMSPAALRAATENGELGFWICTRCMILMPVNYTGDCLECLSSVSTVEVATEEDRKIALASITEA
jgi:hypothetical protein